MQKIKKLMILLVFILFISSFSMHGYADQPSDTFDITVTGEYLWIDITNASWALGTIAMSSSHYTNGSGASNKTFLADMSNTSVNSDLKLQITSDASTWSSATAGNSIDTDTYRLNASIDYFASQNQIVSASSTTISSAVTAGEDEYFDLRFDAPSSTSTGSAQSITITASVVKS